jgi:integrase
MAGRHPNGEGTIYRRKDGRYEAAIFLPTATGVSKRIRLCTATRQEAHRRLTELKARAHEGIPVPDKNWKVGDYLDYWLENVVRKRRATTYVRYEAIVRLHLKPALGKCTLNRLSVQNVQSAIDEAPAKGRSVSTVHQMRKVLSAAFTHAQRKEWLFRNVARLVELASYRRRKVHPWTTDEINRFLEVSRPDPFYPAYVLLVLYGLRRGEVLGLRWCDVDFKYGVLRIEQQLQRVAGELRQSDLKTEAGRRDEPLVSAAAEVLREQRVKQLAARAAAGERWQGPGNDLELVFTTRTGRPIDPRNLFRSFIRICTQNGIRRITVHGVRHTNITVQKNVGVPDRDIQKIVGHTDVRTTQNVTGQVIDWRVARGVPRRA